MMIHNEELIILIMKKQEHRPACYNVGFIRNTEVKLETEVAAQFVKCFLSRHRPGPVPVTCKTGIKVQAHSELHSKFIYIT